jgi:hypothetical protein
MDADADVKSDIGENRGWLRKKLWFGCLAIARPLHGHFAKAKLTKPSSGPNASFQNCGFCFVIALIWGQPFWHQWFATTQLQGEPFWR